MQCVSSLCGVSLLLLLLQDSPMLLWAVGGSFSCFDIPLDECIQIQRNLLQANLRVAPAGLVLVVNILVRGFRSTSGWKISLCFSLCIQNEHI